MEPVELPMMRVATNAAAELADLIAVWEDLQFVIDCCERLLKLPPSDNVGQNAWWSAALVAYARCWETGVRRSLDSTMLEELDPALLRFHSLAIALRNKHVAHSVNSFEDVAVAIVRAPADAPNAGSVVGVGAHRLIATLDVGGVKHMGALALGLLEKIRDRRRNLTDAVLAEARRMTMDELDALPRLTFQSRDHSKASARRRRGPRPG